MEWLLELMGYIRNVAYQSTSVQNVALDEVQSRGVICGSLKIQSIFSLPKEEHVAARSSLSSLHFWETRMTIL